MRSPSASELHPVSLYAGDTVKYYFRAFVAGDLRWYSLIPGQCAAPTRSSTFNQALPAAIRSAIEATLREHRRRCEDIVPESSQSEEDRDELLVAEDFNAGASSNTTLDDSVFDDDQIHSPLPNTSTKGEDIFLAATQMIELSEAESASKEKLARRW
ncbi:hypothetical protein PI124_g8388 [Phytophthora idaei]|nr:hypothetical protein PI125_g8656 [Phytophthora idaei]KAG3159299.1 hypothetical protein PI126_g7471 [Phytophthora idaei]KAG3246922.1 hypothetical protein PI124_g8388 [Phytophthora idaei]